LENHAQFSVRILKIVCSQLQFVMPTRESLIVSSFFERQRQRKQHCTRSDGVLCL